MNAFLHLKNAVRALRRNVMRLFLTMLGIIIGVASVITMLAIGEGSRMNIQSSIASLGTNTLTVYPGSSTTGGIRMGAGSTSTLMIDDALAVRQRSTAISALSPVVQRFCQIVSGSRNWRSLVVGAQIDYFGIRNLSIDEGTVFSESDDRAAAKVCVIGQTVLTNIFGEGSHPVGMIIRINSMPFVVVGTIGAKGQNTFGQDQDDIVIAPFGTVQKRVMSTTTLNSILCSAATEDDVEKARDEIATIIRQQHKIYNNSDDDFTVRSQSDISGIFGSVSSVLTILLASIASISLIVGGIGIMNIMLVSVTERTREIGIRMAVGARGRDIMLQFLIESVVISLLGGLLGSLLGLGASAAVARFGNWPIIVTVQSVALSFAFSTIIGIFFGWYPARKASALNPIDALRYE